ncbi:MAG TPA: hypothetical protein VJN22_05295 [Candidatus Eremiobacteraceae bacterium]|nr:hypothetical protein [Candidatus Eremiobacteraceae bacterium]
MKRAATFLLMLVRILFAIQLILGISFWTGHGISLIGAHMTIGLAIVVCLWISAILAAVARVQTGIVVAGFVWGVVVIALGMSQDGLVPGPAHWTIQVLHLLVGFGAIGLNERLNRSTLGVDHP